MNRERPSYTPARRWRIALLVIVATACMGLLAVMLNFISARHFYRWNSRKSEPLSAQTKRILATVTNTVKVVAYYDRRDPLFNAVSQLLAEYKLLCPKLDVQYVDYRYPGRAETIRAQYKLGPDSEENRIIFDCAGRVVVVPARELSVYDYSKIGTGQDVPRTGFKGEQLFTSAIFSVLEARERMAYFLQGHGEHDPKSDNESRGYSKMGALMERNNLGVRTLPNLVGSDIPEDCSLLVIAGPQRLFDPREIDKLEKYLNQGGRLFVLFNVFAQTNRTGLERLLSKWNIEVGANQVRDAAQAQSQNHDSLFVTRFGSHPIVNPLLNYGISMVLPRSISHRPNAVQSADAPKVAELAFTSSQGVAISPYGDERQGAIPLIAAAEKGTIQGLGADKGAARVVVTGDSLFLVNYGFDYAANEDFANLAVSWLLNREVLLGEIGPRPVKEYRLVVTEEQFSRLRWIFLAAMPGSVLLLGLGVWVRRRH